MSQSAAFPKGTGCARNLLSESLALLMVLFVCLFFQIFLSNHHTQCRAQTHNSEINSHTILLLSQPQTPFLAFFMLELLTECQTFSVRQQSLKYEVFKHGNGITFSSVRLLV